MYPPVRHVTLGSVCYSRHPFGCILPVHRPKHAHPVPAVTAPRVQAPGRHRAARPADSRQLYVDPRPVTR